MSEGDDEPEEEEKPATTTDEEEEGGDPVATGDSTPNPANDDVQVHMTPEQFQEFLRRFRSDARKQERQIEIGRDGGHTDPVEGDVQVHITPEQFQEFLRRFASEGKQQERQIEIRRGGGHTDPTGEPDAGRTTFVDPTAISEIRLPGYGFTDPVEGSGSSGNTGGVPADAPGLIGGGTTSRLTSAAQQLQINAARVMQKSEKR